MGTKISEFPSATSLTGAELVPIVQGGSTVQTTVSAISATALVQSVAGKIGVVTLASSDITGFNTAAAAAAPVQSVAGKTGAVSIVPADVTGFNAAAASASPVQSVAGKTGAVTLGVSDVSGLQTALDAKLNASGGVISTNSSTDALRITQTGTGNALVVEDSANPDATPFVVDANGSVGIGTSTPGAKLHIAISGTGSGNGDVISETVGANGNAGYVFRTAGANRWGISLTGTDGSNALRFYDVNASAERMRLDSSGNLGLGVTPSAWAAPFAKAFEIGSNGAVTNTSTSLRFANNAYYGSLGWTYKSTAAAAHYDIIDNTHSWHIAPAGTAGTAINFSQAMTLDASGNLTIAGATATKASGTTWSNPSDVRLKDNVRDYNKGIAELMKVRVREWEYNGKAGTTAGMHGLGVLADEVMQVLPETVDEYQAKLNEDDEAESAIKRFNASEITWLLVKSVQELTAKVEAQAAEIAALKESK